MSRGKNLPNETQNNSNSEDSSRNTSSSNPSNDYRPLKRNREHLARCDCDDIDVPLCKRINGLNIERNTVKNGISDEHQQVRNSFEEKYSYPTSHYYYDTNHLLYHLHQERMIRRHQHNQNTSSIDSNPPSNSSSLI